MATKALEKTKATVAGCCASVLAAPLPEADAQELAHGFAALADPVRLRLFSLVASADEVCSCDLQAVLGKSQPTISHHTKALAEAGLIVGDVPAVASGVFRRGFSSDFVAVLSGDFVGMGLPSMMH
ncbi:MAG TPA: helix-turn-helix transcriptional regulator [Acidimicrobiales bacterium]